MRAMLSRLTLTVQGIVRLYFGPTGQVIGMLNVDDVVDEPWFVAL